MLMTNIVMSHGTSVAPLTVISPIPTSGVRVEVNTELDCTTKVMTAPMRMLKYPYM